MPAMHPKARLLVLDLVAVLVFVTIGRRTHSEGSALSGIVRTAGPFLLALVIAWVMTQAWKRPFEGPTGGSVWIITVALGMILRRTVFDRGTALAFVIVATGFLGVTMLGWRFVAWRVAKRSGAPTSIAGAGAASSE